jgi:hypothetical protein
MKSKILFTFLAGLSLAACNSGTAPVNSTANTNAANATANAPANAPANTANAANASNAPVNKPANTAAKTAESGPKRLIFNKGTTNTIEYFDLEPGEAKQFVVGAKKGQDLTIASGGEGGKTTMLTKGKLVDITEEPNNYNATTIEGGDFVFEISNPTKKKIKASINVIIETIGND